MDSTATSLVGCRPRNGSLSSEAPSEAVPDKYGFLGGSQYTRPNPSRRVPLQVHTSRRFETDVAKAYPHQCAPLPG
ncbi:hypothetical protein MRX96_018869 [Rhipicephalus microplus]